MFEISLKTVDQLQHTAMQLEGVAYLQRLLFEDTDGWLRSDDPERFIKDTAASILFTLQQNRIEELHEIVFKL